MVRLGSLVGLFADIHGATGTLARALQRCREEGVETIVLLGDLFDRHEQADRCAAALAGWHVVGVYGNHEREVALGVAVGEYGLHDETIRLLSALEDEVVIGDVRLAHEITSWENDDPVGRMFSRDNSSNGHHPPARLTFTGHTHYRQARDDRGTLDIAHGSLALDSKRRYLVNPGALVIGQYALWDRNEDVISFRNVEP